MTWADDRSVTVTDSGQIVDFLTGDLLEPRPEEVVRQRYLRLLHLEYGYPKEVLAREVAIRYGSGEVRDTDGHPVRADIVAYKSAAACRQRDQGKIVFVVECKREKETDGYNQLVSYIYNTAAQGGVWFNGDEVSYYRRLAAPTNVLEPWAGLPRHGETWDAIGRRTKSDLARPKDVKGLLRRCHSKLHGRGADGEEEDLAMDMVRLILAKAHDEEKPGDLPSFYCTPEEYLSPEGRTAVATRIQGLFREAAELHPDVFSEHERIGVGDRAICDATIELQPYRILSDLAGSEDWDLLGHAYEEYTATHLKRTRGQFFTNRLVVDFMTAVVDPRYDDVALDPAGGSGGFLTSALRHVRKSIVDSPASYVAKSRQLDVFRNRLFMVEISRRLVKIAKTSMILNGDGHGGMTRGDSLGGYDDLAPRIRDECGRGRPTVILTNPPFAGVGEGRVRDTSVLTDFRCGKRWSGTGGDYLPTDEVATDGVPPELLFFERVLDWVAPGGRVGIVMPKSFLDTETYRPGRALLFREARLLAVINCHKNTFQPHTGVRTCLVFLEKLPTGTTPTTEGDVFMAISRKVGQDSEGVPIYRRDSTGRLTDRIDADLDDILADVRAWRSGRLVASETRFAVPLADIDSFYRINPQAFLPALNETVRRVERIDGVGGWSVSSLGNVLPGIEIFKGPRLKSENIIVEGPDGAEVEAYYTPSAVLQDKADSVKWLDVGRASRTQLKTIDKIRVHRGDIVVTRSGSVGRVAMVTRRLDGAIVSDDLIRIRVPNEHIRLYIYAFLQSRAGQDQLLRNEYGAVQQHVEPEHVRDILVPIPPDWDEVQDIVASARQQVQYREAAEQAADGTMAVMEEALTTLMTATGSEEDI